MKITLAPAAIPAGRNETSRKSKLTERLLKTDCAVVPASAAFPILIGACVPLVGSLLHAESGNERTRAEAKGTSFVDMVLGLRGGDSTGTTRTSSAVFLQSTCRSRGFARQPLPRPASLAAGPSRASGAARCAARSRRACGRAP